MKSFAVWHHLNVNFIASLFVYWLHHFNQQRILATGDLLLKLEINT